MRFLSLVSSVITAVTLSVTPQISWKSITVSCFIAFAVDYVWARSEKLSLGDGRLDVYFLSCVTRTRVFHGRHVLTKLDVLRHYIICTGGLHDRRQPSHSGITSDNRMISQSTLTFNGVCVTQSPYTGVAPITYSAMTHVRHNAAE